MPALSPARGEVSRLAAEIQPGTTFSVGEERRLFSTAEYAAGTGIPSNAVSPDDRRFLLLRKGESIQQSELVLAETWIQRLGAGAAH